MPDELSLRRVRGESAYVVRRPPNGSCVQLFWTRSRCSMQPTFCCRKGAREDLEYELRRQDSTSRPAAPSPAVLVAKMGCAIDERIRR